MTFKEKIDLQLQTSQGVTEEMLKHLTGTYSSGKKIQVGDKYLTGLMFQNDGDEKEKLNFRLVSFHEDEVDTLYQEECSINSPDFDKITLPFMKKK